MNWVKVPRDWLNVEKEEEYGQRKSKEWDGKKTGGGKSKYPKKQLKKMY